MNLRTATIIALIFTAIGAVINLIYFINLGEGRFLGRDGFKAIYILLMLKEASLALFFIALYNRQKPSE